MEPIGKLVAHFPTVTEHINKRNKKVRNHIQVLFPFPRLTGDLF